MSEEPSWIIPRSLGSQTVDFLTTFQGSPFLPLVSISRAYGFLGGRSRENVILSDPCHLLWTKILREGGIFMPCLAKAFSHLGSSGSIRMQPFYHTRELRQKNAEVEHSHPKKVKPGLNFLPF